MNLIYHHVATEADFPFPSNHLYGYLYARNGTFIHAKNTVMEVLAPLTIIREESRKVRGLIELNPFLRLPCKVPATLLRRMVEASRVQLPNEILFHLTHEETRWKDWTPREWNLGIPPQEAGRAFCRPYEKSGGYIPIEVHSHNTMDAFFSGTDNKDETGLRIYGVLGHVDRPVVDLRLRVSVYGHYSVLPYSFVFEPISEVKDA